MGFWEVFGITFFVGLGGAVSPGALLTYTIVKAMETKQRAYWIAIYVSLGHMLAEFILIGILLAGVSTIFSYPLVTLIIGILGGSFLLFIGIRMLIDLWKQKIPSTLMQKSPPVKVKDQDKDRNDTPNISSPMSSSSLGKNTDKKSYHPLLASMGFLISNPYWWLWWATSGISIMVANTVSLSSPLLLIAFVVGKELGAVLWYSSVALLLGYFQKFFSRAIYFGIFGICALFMCLYGGYLILSPLFALLS